MHDFETREKRRVHDVGLFESRDGAREDFHQRSHFGFPAPVVHEQ